jgi:16S rRNA (cytidine1402-2'-O)-methyltransferase
MTIYFGAVPIGNILDVSQRLIDTIQNADIVYCESTYGFNKLLESLQISTNAEIISSEYSIKEEYKHVSYIVNNAKVGKTVLVVSDEGYPVIVDNGNLILRTAIKENVAIDVIPGPSAILQSLILSGFIGYGNMKFLFSFAGTINGKESLNNVDYELIKSKKSIQVLFCQAPYIKDFIKKLNNELMFDNEIAFCVNIGRSDQKIFRGSVKSVDHITEEIWQDYCQTRPRQDSPKGVRVHAKTDEFFGITIVLKIDKPNI